MRQFRGLIDAVGYQLHTERAFRWSLTRALVQTLGGTLDEFPDYVGPEEGHLDPDVIERNLDAILASGAMRR